MFSYIKCSKGFGDIVKMKIRKATVKDVSEIANLAVKMWKTHTVKELEEEFIDYIGKSNNIIFIVTIGEILVGFAQCGLRYDYVEGTISSPVGYLEGIFVEEKYRKRGFAKALVDACQKWAKECGCDEFASDCELNNEASLKFHLKIGFVEKNRIICFAKKLV